MFEQLPETNPRPSPNRRKAMLVAACIQVVLVSTLILVQMLMPERLGQFQLISTIYMASPPLPAPPPPAAAVKRVREVAAEKQPQPSKTVVAEKPPEPIVNAPELSTPAPTQSVPDAAVGGLPGGVPGGAVGGVAEGTPDGIGTVPVPAPPKEPLRVGGNVREPKVVNIVEPRYPREAMKAHIEGVVVLEAVVTETGSVEKVKVISGPSLLIPAAVDAVYKWRYEPTVLNGQPVPVILTARINFALSR